LLCFNRFRSDDSHGIAAVNRSDRDDVGINAHVRLIVLGRRAPRQPNRAQPAPKTSATDPLA
jgi:hypothetical protein